MTSEEKEVFNSIITKFQDSYPNSNIRLEGTMVYANVYDRENYLFVEQGFNTDGYNLLYCLTKLCDLLKEKLR